MNPDELYAAIQAKGYDINDFGGTYFLTNPGQEHLALRCLKFTGALYEGWVKMLEIELENVAKAA